jgi:hypothetical protein
MAATGQKMPIGTEGDGINIPSVPIQSIEALPSTDIPQANRFVITATSQDMSIGAEGDGIDSKDMPI